MYLKHIVFDSTPDVSHLYDVTFNWRNLPRKGIPEDAMELFDSRYCTDITGKSHTMILDFNPNVVDKYIFSTVLQISKVGNGKNEAVSNAIQNETSIKVAFEQATQMRYQNFYFRSPFYNRELFRLAIDQLWGFSTPHAIFLHDPNTLEILNDEYTNHRFEYPHFGPGTAYERAKIASPLWHVIEKHNVYLLETQPDGRMFAKHLQFNKTQDKIEVEDSYLFKLPSPPITELKQK